MVAWPVDENGEPISSWHSQLDESKDGAGSQHSGVRVENVGAGFLPISDHFLFETGATTQFATTDPGSATIPLDMYPLVVSAYRARHGRVRSHTRDGHAL